MAVHPRMSSVNIAILSQIGLLNKMIPLAEDPGGGCTVAPPGSWTKRYWAVMSMHGCSMHEGLDGEVPKSIINNKLATKSVIGKKYSKSIKI